MYSKWWTASSGHPAAWKEGPLAPCPSFIFPFSPGFSSFFFVLCLSSHSFLASWFQPTDVWPPIFSVPCISYLISYLMHELFWFLTSCLSKNCISKSVYILNQTNRLVPAFCVSFHLAAFYLLSSVFCSSLLFSLLCHRFPFSSMIFFHSVERSPSTVQFQSPL